MHGRDGACDDFRSFHRKRRRKLYISACDLDTAERVIFGPDENSEVTISQAVQASSALPIFYKPARINGVDYVDGGVRHTANIDVAIEKGADLIICYNPFRPFLNRIDSDDDTGSPYFADGRYLADRGLKMVINQVFRTLLHSRLKLGIQRYLADDRFRGDIVLLEPREHDANFFSVNPIALGSGPDVFGDNKRCYTLIDTDHAGTLCFVEVGAFGVGAIVNTCCAGHVEAMDEKGYFKFGGSSVVLVFEPGRIRFCEDLVANSDAGKETLVRVGQPLATTLE